MDLCQRFLNQDLVNHVYSLCPTDLSVLVQWIQCTSLAVYLSHIFIWNLWGFNIGHFLLLLGFKYGCACCWSQMKIYYCVRCQASWTQGSILLCRQIRAPALLGWRWIRFFYKNAELCSAIELIAAVWDALLFTCGISSTVITAAPLPSQIFPFSICPHLLSIGDQ